jgi:hypothetical protein
MALFLSVLPWTPLLWVAFGIRSAGGIGPFASRICSQPVQRWSP